MGSYFRLKETGYDLPAGCHVLAPGALGALEAATQIIEAAHRRAGELKAAAEEAYRQECDRGYQDGLAQARQADVERLLQESQALDQALRDVEVDVVTVVISALRKLTQDFSDFAKAESVVRAALRQMRREKKAELRVGPAQYAAFRDCAGKIAQDFPEVELVDVVEDATLGPTRVVVETSIGRVEGEFGASLVEFERLFGLVAVRPSASEESQAAEEEVGGQ